MVYFTDARQGGQTRAITGDAKGEFYIWNVGNGQVRALVRFAPWLGFESVRHSTSSLQAIDADSKAEIYVATWGAQQKAVTRTSPSPCIPDLSGSPRPVRALVIGCIKFVSIKTGCK